MILGTCVPTQSIWVTRRRPDSLICTQKTTSRHSGRGARSFSELRRQAQEARRLVEKLLLLRGRRPSKNRAQNWGTPALNTFFRNNSQLSHLVLWSNENITCVSRLHTSVCLVKVQVARYGYGSKDCLLIFSLSAVVPCSWCCPIRLCSPFDNLLRCVATIAFSLARALQI